MTFMNRIKHKYTLLLAIMLILGLALQMGIGGVFAENEKATTTKGTDGYIYFDLAAGNVTITDKTYTGSVYVNGTPTPVTGSHTAENKYYVYQSNTKDESSGAYCKKTGYETSEDFNEGKDNGSNCRVPVYPRVKYDNKVWTEYIKNNTEVKEVSRNWTNAATASERTSTGNNITFARESGYTADVTVDNIWSMQHENNPSRTTGGIGAHLYDQKNTSINLHLKGDNRVGCVHYSSDRGAQNHITFSNGDDPSTPGSITVADFPNQWGYNHWNAAIGAADQPPNSADSSDGIVIDSGVIYAGTTPEDNCTAIGGGGNQYGGVTINNGEVTAVAATTGTAIGGGIGWGNPGGDADVTINNGTVYAYNMGIHGEKSTDKYEHYVPAVAIGGGSSQGSNGNDHTTVTINGGKVYAQCMGGAAIGGGGSTSGKGGGATINIKGGTVIAKSTSGTFQGIKDDGIVNIPVGVSIGGGTGLKGGGTVELNISGENTILRTGSIGGGTATGKDKEGNPYKVGSANVEIKGGDITGQVVMAGGAGSNCTFKMSGGRIHDTDLIHGNSITDIEDPNSDELIKYIRDNGGAVFMDDPNGETTITGGTIEGCTAENGGAIYMAGGTANIKRNPDTNEIATIRNNTATEDGGGVYLPGGDFMLDGGTISGNEAKNGGGIFLSKAPILKEGTISANKAKENGGGMDISGCLVELAPEDEVAITNNEAKNGAGIYISAAESENSSGTGSTGTSGGSDSSINSVDAITSSTMNPNAVGLHVMPQFDGVLKFTDNKATENGGAACVKAGRFVMDSDRITVTGNSAKNGGGVAVSGGNFTMTKGSIGAEKGTEGKTGANTAENGGGAYISQGDIWLKGGSINHNVATASGGGAYVAGNYNMLAGEVLSNKALNGGGIYVNDGTVTMYGGNVDSNIAKGSDDGKVKGSGGGMYVSSTGNKALVDIFSGSISGNESDSGGGVAVISESNESIDVTVGVNCVHPGLNKKEKGRPYNEFNYPNQAVLCGDAHKEHGNHITDGSVKHASCPQVKNNVASDNGGGFFLKSSNTNLVFYCINEEGNKAEGKEQCYNMDVLGGHVKIGDNSYKYDDPNSVGKGNIVMTSSIFVEGGTVDIYGEMDNPKFTDDVTVDIKQDSDYYIDHRLTADNNHKFYKVHYYENFKGDGDTPTGLYIARQYPDIDHDQSLGDEKYDFTIMPSIFSHPGYKIVGWNTKQDDTGEKYEVNATYNLKQLDTEGKLGAPSGNETDNTLLVIYAIWERTEYALKFDPNVGVGESYTGTMKNQNVQVGVLNGSQKISENKFERTGYKFKGWTLSPTPADTDHVYADKEPITTDFTKEDGATVTLYAKWEKCEHVGHLTYTAKDNVLTEECSACGGHTATATLSAVNSTYDGKKHLATADFSDNWLGTKPAISYEMAANNEWDDKDNIRNDWEKDPNHKPLHAGDYTAGITATGKDGNTATANAQYEISPLKWETPAVPQIIFKVDASKNSIIEITSPVGDDSTGKKIEYKITCLENNTGNEKPVEGYKDWRESNQFSNIKLGDYYYFYAKQCADRDHFDSDPSRSEAYLADGGNIVYIKNDTGIKVVPNIGDGNFTYTVSADTGYHLRNYHDNLDKAIEDSHKVDGAPAQAHNDNGITVKRDKQSTDEYKYTVNFDESKVAYWQLTLEFSGAAKNASVSHKVTDGQVFRDFNSKDTSISRDSAFTAQFTVSDYIPVEYEVPVLKFSKELPKGTTVIMKTDGGYWHYKLENAEGPQNDSIKLTDFTTMGGMNKFSFDTTDTSVKTFTYQFIVDFSQSAGATVTDKDKPLKVNLNLKAVEPTNAASEIAPTIPEDGKNHISLDIKEKATFNISVLEPILGKSANITCGYNPSDGAASIWNDRETALVLTAKSDVEVPADLTLTTVVDGKNTLYTMNSKKQFIIPLGEIGGRSIQATLNSGLFGDSPEDLEFTADWYVSQSRADKSPLNGYKAATHGNIKFSCQKDTLPSVRIDGEKRICEQGGSLSVDVKYKGIPTGNKIKAYLQKRNDDGTYSETGANVEILDGTQDAVINEKSKPINFSMGNMEQGTYRILVIVEEGSANILQVPYYFIIK